MRKDGPWYAFSISEVLAGEKNSWKRMEEMPELWVNARAKAEQYGQRHFDFSFGQLPPLQLLGESGHRCAITGSK